MLLAAFSLLLALAPAPSIVAGNAFALTQIDRFEALPAGIRAGKFTVDGTSAAGWEMSDPGGPFNPTDTPAGNAPGRRLIFAGCNATLCAIHYERGGIAHFYEVLVLYHGSDGWKAVWNIYGPKPLRDLSALQALVADPAIAPKWSVMSVRGDF